MRIVVTGATGNVGTSVVAALARDPQVTEIVGLARRAATLSEPRTRCVEADVLTADLDSLFAGADAVVHLAWLIQPARDRSLTRTVNVDGSRRVFEAAARARAAIVYASSVGAYSPGPKDRAVDETWPTGGIASSFYSTDKAEVERVLDAVERANPSLRSARLRPGLIFQRGAASEIRRLFAGPLLPNPLLHPRLIPVVPALERLRFQALHSDDVAEAYRLAAVGDARGAFNVAADPVLDPEQLGRALGARPVPVDARILRAVVDATFRLRLQPTEPGWLDMALAVPVMDTRRARDELGWTPARSSSEALLELLDGMRRGDGAPTPPLEPGGAGRLRWRELASGVGARLG